MKKKALSVVLLFVLSVCLSSCLGFGRKSSFSIQFIDVGQGDAALIECDGHYMLIDGGDKTAGEKVYNVLQEKRIQRLDILAISHFHQDHIGGLVKALKYATSIKMTISNATYSDLPAFSDLEHELSINGANITVPRAGEKYKLGSAEVKVMDVNSDEENDSLVLLVTYKNNKFLFTGDIEEHGQRKMMSRYPYKNNNEYDVDLIKMPHHGGKVLVLFMETFKPKYAVISVGKGQQYNHPLDETLKTLEQLGAKVYRTDVNGDIIVKSDGKNLSFETTN